MASSSSDVKLGETFSFVLSVLRDAGLIQSETALLQEIYERGLGPVVAPEPDNEASDPSTDTRHAASDISSEVPARATGDQQQPSHTQQHDRARPAPGKPVSKVPDATSVPTSFVSAVPWGKGVEEYDSMDDVGYKRKRVACQEQFVQQELELANSEEGSEPYSSTKPSAATGASKNRSVSASDEDEQSSSAAASGPTVRTEPGHANTGDVWDLGPRDIKIADPVTTPQKSSSQRSTDEPRPVLSRVESLSSSFKDFELERLDDGRCMSRGSQPSEPDHASEDGIRFNLPGSDLAADQASCVDLDLFANATKAAALSTALFKLQSSNAQAQAAGSEAGTAKANEESDALDASAAEAKETVGGFSFPVTPSTVVSLDPKPLTPWPIRSNSTSERWLEAAPFFASSEGVASRSKQSRGTMDDAAGAKHQQRTASDSGVLCGQSGKEQPQSLSAPLSSVSTTEADGRAAEADGGAGSGTAAEAGSTVAEAVAGSESQDRQRRSDSSIDQPRAPAPSLNVEDDQDLLEAGASAVAGPGAAAAPPVPSSPGRAAEEGAGASAAHQGVAETAASGLDQLPSLSLAGPSGGEDVDAAEEEDMDADSASLSGPYIQPPPVDWMADVEEGEGEEEDLEEAAREELHMPKYSIDESGAILYHYDEGYIQRKYEVFPLQVIHRRHRTGFEETKDFPIRMNDLIAGRYQVMDFLGSAAFSRAVQALDIKTNTLVCLKIVKNNKDYFDQSLDEIKLLKYVNSSDPRDEHGVVRLFDYFYYKEHLFLVCELLRANLYEFQKYNKESGEELYFTNARIQKIAISVLRSLAFLHSLDLIHSDLKPENILIKSYSRCEVKVIDLGSSCFVTDQLSSYVQSRSYRAPEVILGLPYDQKIDIWSLGCILAELSSGYVLFQNDSVATLLARLEGILGRTPPWMIEKGRYSNMFFTRSHQLYERTQPPQAPGSASGSATAATAAAAAAAPAPPSAGDCYELLVPKKTCLQNRLPAADAGLLSFVSCLLSVDPHKRPSATEALRHPWLQHKYKSLDSMA